MSDNSLSKPSRSFRRWQRLLALFLTGWLSCISTAAARAQNVSIYNKATAAYSTSTGVVDIISNQIPIVLDDSLIDPGGRLLGCSGNPLDSYVGFSMALYEPDASGLDLGKLVSLTPTTDSDNRIPPNLDNQNPFSLTPEGRYNFLLDSDSKLSSGLSQTEPGAEYILLIDAPDNSLFSDRRVKIQITDLVRNAQTSEGFLSYRATSLDGQPISADSRTELSATVEVRRADIELLTLFQFELDAAICEISQIKITKSADRSAAQPGDLAVYRLNIQNVSDISIDSVSATDTLPVGFELVPESVSGQIEDRSVEVDVEILGNTVRFSVDETIPVERSLDIVYATRLTPDALRGSGRNSALVTARRTDSGFRIQDGPSIHRMTLDPGILSDCGTLLGRVFEDKNFDGEQQPGEAGIPNAVIFLDDGNRVVTDADGLFSVQKMLPGQRTGTIDLASLPGYTLAPNLYFNERNSHSRLVNLAPGGLVRMNFGVTPTFQEMQE